MRIGDKEYQVESFSVEVVMGAKEIEVVLEEGGYTYAALEKALSQSQLGDIAHHLIGTCGSAIEALAATFPDMNEDVVSSIDDSNLCYLLADFAETCQGCGWWHRPSELSCEHDVVGYCSSCIEDYCEHCRETG
jgi:hypothetical protein